MEYVQAPANAVDTEAGVRVMASVASSTRAVADLFRAGALLAR